jgi:hypothetical protein
LAERRDRRTRQRLERRLRALVARGHGLPTCARLLRVPQQTLQDWAHRLGLQLKPHTLSRDKDQAILDRLATGERPRAIMRSLGVSFGAVARRRARQTLDAFRELEGPTALPTSEWRCTCGLLLKITPCLRCGTHRPTSRPRKTLPVSGAPRQAGVESSE